MEKGTQQLRETHQMDAHRGTVRCVQFEPNNRYLLSGGEDGAVYLWDVTSATCVRKPASHSEPIHAIYVSSSGKYIMSCDIGNTTCLMRQMDGYVTWWKDRAPMFFLPEDTEILSLRPDGSFRVFDIAGGAELTRKYPRIRIVAFTLDFKRILCRDDTGLLNLVDGNNWKSIRVCHLPFNTSYSGCFLSCDGRRLVTLTEQGLATQEFVLWDIEHGRLVTPLGKLSIVQFTADGRGIVCVQPDNTILWRDLETGRELRRFQVHRGTIRMIRLTLDEKRLISASDDKTIRVWSTDTGREIYQLKGHLDDVTCLDISADGRTLVSGSADSTICIWELPPP